jgi:hypothetical protein
MNEKFKNLLNEKADFTRFIELAEKEFLDVGKDFEKLDQELRSILLLWWLSMEFIGGGVEMYLRGICANHHYEILELLEEIGAEDLRSILSSADDLFDDLSVPTDRIIRNRKIDDAFNDATIDAWDSLRESIDRRYENSREESPGGLLLKYFSQHKK